MLPGVEGLRGPLSCLNEARYGIIWGVMGAARACFESAVNYCEDADPVRQADRVVPADAEEAHRHGARAEQGHAARVPLGADEGAGAAPARAREHREAQQHAGALEIARTARGIHGANGITLEYPIMRHMTNLESVITYEGTEEVHTLVIGEAITGLRAFT